MLGAMREDIRDDNEGKKNAVKLRGGYGRGVPVEDCIATTGAMVKMGYEGEGGAVQKR